MWTASNPTAKGFHCRHQLFAVKTSTIKIITQIRFCFSQERLDCQEDKEAREIIENNQNWIKWQKYFVGEKKTELTNIEGKWHKRLQNLDYQQNLFSIRLVRIVGTELPRFLFVFVSFVFKKIPNWFDVNVLLNCLLVLLIVDVVTAAHCCCCGCCCC